MFIVENAWPSWAGSMSSSRTPIRFSPNPLNLLSAVSYQQYKEGRFSLFCKSIACRNGIESEKCEAPLNFDSRSNRVPAQLLRAQGFPVPNAPRFNWTSSDEESENSPNTSDSEPENFIPR